MTKQATPRPWMVSSDTTEILARDGNGNLVAICRMSAGDADQHIPDTVLIIKAVNAYDALREDNRRLRDKIEKVASWLDRLASAAEELAKDTRFQTLAEANAFDAKNYRAVAKDIRAALASGKGE